jgi:hypothetical protein
MVSDRFYHAHDVAGSILLGSGNGYPVAGFARGGAGVTRKRG